MEGTLATIMIFAGNFAPRGWSFCAGQLISIAENDALFALIGTTYGGDGQVTFGLPDLRSRVPVGTGTGGGLSPVVLGQMAGTENVTVLTSQMPAHQHAMVAKVSTTSVNADGSNSPKLLATPATNLYAPTSASTGTNLGGASAVLNPSGGSQPIGILQPYLAINYVICMEGIFPSRN